MRNLFVCPYGREREYYKKNGCKKIKQNHEGKNVFNTNYCVNGLRVKLLYATTDKTGS